MPTEEGGPSPESHDRVACQHRNCPGVIEASVQLWLTLHADGTWSVCGVGDEAGRIVCDWHGHQNLTPVLHKSLSAFLDELLPHSTWDGSKPTDPPERPWP